MQPTEANAVFLQVNIVVVVRREVAVPIHVGFEIPILIDEELRRDLVLA